MENREAVDRWNTSRTSGAVKLHWKVVPNENDDFKWEKTNTKNSPSPRKIHIAEVNGTWESRRVETFTPVVEKWDADGELAHPIYYYSLRDSDVKNLKGAKFKYTIEKAISNSGKSPVAIRDVRWKYES